MFFIGNILKKFMTLDMDANFDIATPEYIQKLIKNYPDFPKPGILFRDINPVFRDIRSLGMLGDYFHKKFMTFDIDHIAGIEARGFIISTILGLKFNKGVIMVRKAGKLPGTTIKESYDIEYGSAVMELQSDSLQENDRILIADDLIATGGTAVAAAKLVENLGGKVAGFAFIVELSSLGGGKLLREKGYSVQSLVTY